MTVMCDRYYISELNYKCLSLHLHYTKHIPLCQEAFEKNIKLFYLGCIDTN